MQFLIMNPFRCVIHTVDFITALFTLSIMLCAKVGAISKDISLLWLVLGTASLICFPCVKSCAFERADCWRVFGSSVRPLRCGIIHHASACTK
jgi:hypothetical protein